MKNPGLFGLISKEALIKYLRKFAIRKQLFFLGFPNYKGKKVKSGGWLKDYSLENFVLFLFSERPLGDL